MTVGRVVAILTVIGVSPMDFSVNDRSAHSNIRWTYDDKVTPGLIREIVRLLIANQFGPYFRFSDKFVPVGQIDILARDIADLFNTTGFSKEATDTHARLVFPNDADKRQKLILIFDLVRGTLVSSKIIRMG